MRPTTSSKTGTGQTSWIPVDWTQNPFNTSFAVVVDGTITYTVEHTFDNVFDPDVTPTAFAHDTIAAQTTSQDGNYEFPVTAIRINNTAGTGTSTITIIQGRNR